MNLRTMGLSGKGGTLQFQRINFYHVQILCSFSHIFPHLYGNFRVAHCSAQDNQLGMGRSAALRRHRPRIPKAKGAVLPSWEMSSGDIKLDRK